MCTNRVYLIVNFGGPRDLGEVEEFLIALLTDQEVIQSSLPGFIHRLFFSWVAKRRSKRVLHDYAAIGGKSPIFEDTEALAQQLRETLKAPVITFHRYIPKTHLPFLAQMNALEHCDEIRVFPLFPQFSYTTTGSIARWFKDHLPKTVTNKMHWIKSYPDDPLYLKAFATVIAECLDANSFLEEETVLLFSAHGLPQRYINNGDVYERECKLTAQKLSAHFPRAVSELCYQSQFGKELWLKPSTIETCNASGQWTGKYK
ncbi:MAG: ferrochelatase, partial [Chlamydiota bacterium]